MVNHKKYFSQLPEPRNLASKFYPAKLNKIFTSKLTNNDNKLFPSQLFYSTTLATYYLMKYNKTVLFLRL